MGRTDNPKINKWLCSFDTKKTKAPNPSVSRV
jgi:hypothetical protein